MWKWSRSRLDRRSSRRPVVPFRPRLEVLEDRVVPAVITVNNPTDTAVAGETNLRQASSPARKTVTLYQVGYGMLNEAKKPGFTGGTAR